MAKICHKENTVTLTCCYECSSIVGGAGDGCTLWVSIDELEGNIGVPRLLFINCLICLSFSFDVFILDHNFLVS
jgi:hypothetical protein